MTDKKQDINDFLANILAAAKKDAEQRIGANKKEEIRNKKSEESGQGAPGGQNPGATVYDGDAWDIGATVYDGGDQDFGATVYDGGSKIQDDSGKTAYDEGAKNTSHFSLLTSHSPEGFSLPSIYVISGPRIDGGMGSVWKVRHTGWNVDLAMKRPQPKLFTDENAKADFIAECQSWIGLGLHPNIVSCYYVREIDGVPTIFSEWMENGSLENRIKDGSLYSGSEAEVQARLLDIPIQYARGLHYAHESGLIHQDVKPDNLLLTPDWQAKAADFGLAKARGKLTVYDQPESNSATHVAANGIYTPAYCSMEQMDGKVLTRRTDIYSWAVSVMEMYYGSCPWTNGVVAGMTCRSYFIAPEGKVPMPEALQELLSKCMETDPEARPGNFALIEKNLKEIYKKVTGEPYPRPESKAAADTADSLNNRALTYLDLGMTEKAESFWAEALAKEPEHLESVYNQSLHLWRKGKISGTDLLRRCAPLYNDADKNKDSEWGRKALRISEEKKKSQPRSFKCVNREIRNFGFNFQHPQVCLSPDGKHVYTAFDSLGCIETETQKEKYSNASAVGDTIVDKLAVTPDGRFLLYHKMASYHSRGIGQNELVNPGEPESLFIADADTGEQLRVLSKYMGQGHQELITAFCIHPNSTFCYTAGGDKILKWDLTSGKIFASYGTKPESGTYRGKDLFWYGSVRSICVSPDGKRLAAIISGSSSCLIAVWDEVSYQLLNMAETGSGMAALSFSADGKSIIGCGEEGFAVWDPKTLTCDRFPTDAPLEKIWVNPEGRGILTADALKNVRLWDARTFACRRVFHSLEVKIESISASSDLARVAAADQDKNVMIWDTTATVPHAQWELSRIKDYGLVISQEQASERLKAEIADALEKEDVHLALDLLTEAESRFDAHAFFPLRRRLMKNCRRGELTDVYEVASFKILEDYFDLPTMLHHGFIAPDPRGGTLAARFSGEQTIQIRDEQGGGGREITLPESFTPSNFLADMAYSRSGRKLAVGGYDSVLILDPDQGTAKCELKGKEEAYCFGSPDFSPDGKLLAAGTGDDHTFCVWDADSGRLIHELKDDELLTKRVRFTPSGDRVIIVNFSAVLLFDVKTGKIVKNISLREECIDCDLSSDGKRLFLFTDSGLVVMDTETWDRTDGFQPYTRDKDSWSDRYRVSPDGSMMACIKVGNIRIYSMTDHSLMREIPLFETVYQLEFSPDNSMLYAVCGNIVRIYALQRKLEGDKKEEIRNKKSGGSGRENKREEIENKNFAESGQGSPGGRNLGATIYDGSAPDFGATIYDVEGRDLGTTVYDGGGEIQDDSGKTAYDEGAKNTSHFSLLTSHFPQGFSLPEIYLISGPRIDGGMGSVWKVRHTGWNVDLAMKRPQPQLFANETAKGNFISECQAWIDLGLHPNIVSCYYVREIDGVPTIFSEWMDNGSLENRIQDGTLYAGTEAEVQSRLLDIAIQYARGLYYAHESGLIHQDVKPDNLLLTGNWQAKAADFGLAKARAQLTVLDGEMTLRDEDGATHMSPSGGYTPAYCSMEQMDGKPLTRRTDIYSWAVSVMEMYLGSRPWTNGVVAGMGCRTWLGSAEGRVIMPEALQDLLAGCMAAVPDDRPHDFSVIEANLKEIYQKVTGHAYPRPEPEAASDTADSLNNRALTYLDLGMPDRAEELWEAALRKDPEHPEAGYNRNILLWRDGRIEYEELARRCFSEGQMKSGDRAQKHRLLEQAAAENSDTGAVSVFNCSQVEQKRFKTRLNHKNPQLRFSRDGKALFTAFDALCCYDAVSSEQKFANTEALNDTLSDLLEITPDGRRLFYHKMYSYLEVGRGRLDLVPEKGENDLFCADASSGKVLRTLSGHSGRVRLVRFCSDGRHYYAVEKVGANDRIHKRDLETGAEKLVYEDIVSISTLTVRDLCLSPDGSLLCGIIGGIINGRNNKSTLAIWDESTGQLLRTAQTEFRMESLKFSSDGGIIYTCGESGFLVWDTDTLRNSVIETTMGLQKMWISPDGKRLLTTDGDNHVRLWELPDLRCVRVFFGIQNEITGLDALPDLSKIAACDLEGNVLIWDANSPIRRAPWELSVIRDYAAVISGQREEDILTEKIRAAIAEDRMDEAVKLLHQAERDNGPHAYLSLRRMIKGFCTGDKIDGYYEITSVRITPKEYISGSIAVHPFDDNAAVFFEEDESFIQILNENGISIRKVDLPEKFKKITFEALIPSLRYSRSGKHLAVGGVSDVMILDPKTGSRTVQPEGMDLLGVDEFGDGKYFTNLAFSPDEKYILGYWPEHARSRLTLYDLESGRQIWRISENQDVQDICFLPSGRQFAVLGMFELSINDVSDFGRVVNNVKFDDICKGLCPSADGKKLYVYSEDKGVFILDTASLNVSGTFCPFPEEWNYFKPNDKNLYWIRCCISPDERFMAAAKENEIKIWKFGNDTPVLSIDILEDVDQLAFSADGNLLFALCGQTLHIFALQWELKFPGWTEDPGRAEGIIREFKAAFGQPNEEQTRMLLHELRNRGLGFIRPEAVRKLLGK